MHRRFPYLRFFRSRLAHRAISLTQKKKESKATMHRRTPRSLQFNHMAHRFYSVFVWTAWLASMSWLFVAKIWPTLHGGHPPDYSVTRSDDSRPIVWRISWNERRIGMAASRKLSQADGLSVRHVVQFEHLPLDMILSKTFGPLGAMLKTTSGGDQPLELELLLATELRFDRQRQFTGFQTVADLGELPEFLRIHGVVDEQRKLDLTTRFGDSVGGPGKVLRHKIELPSNAVVNDSFAPRAELRNLQVGQKWTIPVYRPFPPNSPVQIVAAHAERHELILWDGHDVETILVVYRSDAGSGLGSALEPVAREWIRDDGLVLQQEVRWSGATIRFERMAEGLPEPIAEFLSDDKHGRLWSVREAR
jgi:hypothetical protein